jgi:hypothetical protein
MKYIKGTNFMTPNIIETINTDKYIIEKSEGKFIDHMIYGITVANIETSEIIHSLSKAVHDVSEMDRYVERLINDEVVIEEKKPA